jgi:hypothetical protein
MITYGDAKEKLISLLVGSIKYARDLYPDVERLFRDAVMRDSSDVYETESLRRGREKVVKINQILTEALQRVTEGVYDTLPLPVIKEFQEVRGKFFKAWYEAPRLDDRRRGQKYNDSFQTWVDSKPLCAEEAVTALCETMDRYMHSHSQLNVVAGILSYMAVRIQFEGIFQTMGPNEVARLLQNHVGHHIGRSSNDHNVLSKVSRCGRHKIRLFFSMGGGRAFNGRGHFYYALGHLWQQYANKKDDDCIEYVLQIGERAKYILRPHVPELSVKERKSMKNPFSKSQRNLERAKGRRRKRR